MKNMEEIKITIDGIIGGIGSPYGEGATYDYNSMGEYSHLDEVDREKLRKDLQVLIDTALAQRDDALIKKIKGMMKEVNDNSNIGEDTEFAYNEALYDILSHLQETVKECHITKNNHNHVEGGLCGLDCHEAGVKITKKIQETEGKV